MTVALLTAAGSGMRMGQDIPKQFMHVENKPIIIHTMEAFQRHPSIDAIIVVTISSWMEATDFSRLYVVCRASDKDIAACRTLDTAAPDYCRSTCLWHQPDFDT